MQKLHYKGFVRLVGYSFVYFDIVFIWIERQSSFDMLKDYSVFKYLIFVNYAETCVFFPINI